MTSDSSFPAARSLRHDRTATLTMRRVYEYLLELLALHEDRPVKAQVHASLVGVSRESFGLVLDALVSRGYLVEGARDLHNVRRFRLAWSLRPEERERAG